MPIGGLRFNMFSGRGHLVYYLKIYVSDQQVSNSVEYRDPSTTVALQIAKRYCQAEAAEFYKGGRFLSVINCDPSPRVLDNSAKNDFLQ